MEMTVCDTLGWYGECLDGDSTANTAAILLNSPSSKQAGKTGILQTARWALRLDGEVVELQDDQEFWTSIVDRVSSEQLTSISIIGHVPNASAQALQGLELSQRVAKRDEILAAAHNATISSAELFQAGLDKYLPSYAQVSVVALFYQDDCGTRQLHRPADETHAATSRSGLSAPVC